MTTKIPVELSSTPGIVDGSNATAITIDSSERVGIGTTSPASILHVDEGSDDDVKIIAETHAGGDSMILFSQGASGAGSPTWGIGLDAGSGTSDGLSIGFEDTGYNDFSLTSDSKLVITTAGNVGIGTTSPNAKLEVTGSSDGNLTSAIFANTVQGGTNDTVAVELQLAGTSGQVAASTLRAGKGEDWTSGTSRSGFLAIEAVLDGTNRQMAYFGSDGDGSSKVSFSTNNSERMRIDSNATEGSFFRANNWAGSSINTIGGPAMEIGYAGSSGYLHGYNRNSSSYIPVSYDGTEHRWYLSGTGPNAVLNSNGQFLINFSNPASTSNFLLGVDGSIGLGGDDFIASGAGYGPSNSSAGAGTIKLYDTGTGNMQFNQTYSNARYYFYHGGNEVFRIEDGGFSGIYGYSFHYTTTHGSVGIGALNTGYHHTMALSGPSTFYWNNRCEASGGFHTYSDERLKENITNISGALDKVALMNGVTFNWIDAENRGSGDTGKQFGVIAQNMLTIDPELPSLNPDPLATQEDIDNEELETDYYTMDYSRITPFLIEAIKELKTKLEAAEARITELEG